MMSISFVNPLYNRFVWPNRFHLYFPLDKVRMESNKSFLLPKPAGVIELKIVEGRNLLRKDKWVQRNNILNT